MTKMWYIYTMQCYSILKSREILIQGVAWMNIEDVLGEGSQSQKNEY